MGNRSRVTLLVLASLLSVCGDGDKKAVAEQRKIHMPTEVVQTADIPDIDSEPGSVISDERIDVTSRVVGFIRNLDVREGQKVGRGDVLVQIAPATSTNRLSSLSAHYDSQSQP